MGQNDFFRKGDWNVICDYCGLKYKASECKMTWDNQFVCVECWEPRHPQDYVRAKVDRQRVGIVRPDIPEDDWFETTLNAAHVATQTTITLSSTAGLAQYMSIGIEMDRIVQDASGITGDNIENATARQWHWSVIDSVSSPTVVIKDGLEFPASSGRGVIVLINDYTLSVGDITVAGDFEVP